MQVDIMQRFKTSLIIRGFRRFTPSYNMCIDARSVSHEVTKSLSSLNAYTVAECCNRCLQAVATFQMFLLEPKPLPNASEQLPLPVFYSVFNDAANPYICSACMSSGECLTTGILANGLMGETQHGSCAGNIIDRKVG